MSETCIPVAQYLRMSTEHQKYSLANQADAISRFAVLNQYVVIKTYTDPGRSGLALDNRPGLKQLISDVLGGQGAFRAILVYDVSRWGRFPNPDEAAHYEFLCKSSGIPVLYCAETFSTEITLPNTLMKALKRTMAREYSRELSLRVKYGKARVAAEGLRTGGDPLYGLRRLLLDYDGRPKQVLDRGERRCIGTGRVVDARGPEEECKVVQRIFREFVEERRKYLDIAERLNSEGIPFIGGRKWSIHTVRNTLRRHKYMGIQLYREMPGHWRKQSGNIPACWGKVKLKFTPIISEEMFQQAQERIRKYSPRPRRTDDDLLESLRIVVRDHGYVSRKLIRKAGFSDRTYEHRFGSISKSLALIGISESLFKKRRVTFRP